MSNKTKTWIEATYTIIHHLYGIYHTINYKYKDSLKKLYYSCT